MTAPPPPEKKELVVGSIQDLGGGQLASQGNYSLGNIKNAGMNELNTFNPQAQALAMGLTPPAPASRPIASIAKAISSVMAEVGVVAKDGTNKFHGYKYATIGDVLHKLTPLLGKHGLMIVQNEVEHKFDQRHIAVTYEFTIAHSSGEVWPDKPRKTGMAIAVDSKGSWDDKSFNKAATAARKYFLLELFQVPTGDMDDSDSEAGNAGHAEAPSLSVSRAPAPPPPPSPPAVDATKPHRIVLGKGSGAPAWAEAFIKAVGKAASSNELQAWIETNSPIMANLATSHPDLYTRVQAATTTKHESFEVTPVADAPPDPTEDPDAAIDAIKARLFQCQTQEELEEYWNLNIEPTKEKWFPPDLDLLLKEFERNEVRIAAEQAK